MITKIEVGTVVLIEVEEVLEMIQNEGDYLMRGLSLYIKESKKNTMKELEKIFSGTIPAIKVYGKEQLEAEDETYGEEKLLKEYTDYTGMKSIYYSTDTKRFHVSLTMSAARIADNKYKELLAERDKLSKDIDDLNVTIAELIGTKEGA
ncbi:MAG: hypothetical protein Q4A78_07475 [Peptostreptococcaceae bacterium]|nr:hypothetical protein [Peptostreptococcaceae bacterium]